jgi:diguanylate cyclase (GGDEF)-like protein/PAS domain S-box-containing protein
VISRYAKRHAIKLILLSMMLVSAASSSAQQASSAGSQITRHPLETRALTDPEGVLQALPDLTTKAALSKNHKELALLYLAKSNACRVMANWSCQSESGQQARIAAEAANIPELRVRGLISESRGRIAMQDFTQGENLLGDAQQILESHPNPELSADIYLAYSSLSYSLGQNSRAADYANRGLNALSTTPSLPIRIRLLRNQARAYAQLGENEKAESILEQAILFAEEVQDPKLNAELHLEIARIARTHADVATQIENGQKILALANQLSNSQLTGLGHEVLGLAALSEGENAEAELELRIAQKSFNELKLYRDERRALRALVGSMLGRNGSQAEIAPLSRRLMDLEFSLEADDRKLAADDSAARLKYAQQKFDLQKLQAANELSAEREARSASQKRLISIVAILSLLVLLVLGILNITQRRFSTRLKEVISQLQESESRYRMLAENSRDLVVRMQLDGQRLYVSPATRDMLGMEPDQLMQPRWDLVHPDDVNGVVSAIKKLGDEGGSATVIYRAKHANGGYVWIEALARAITNPVDDRPFEIVYSGRDISARVHAEQALLASESRMRAITDNIPALVAQLDLNQRYLFANSYFSHMFGIHAKDMIGRTIREIRGENVYANLEPHIQNVLEGNTDSFEGSSIINGQEYYYQSYYVPDRDSAGDVKGFYSLTFDITPQKVAESKLDKLARIDSLTGVANRRHFEERLSAMLAHSKRQQEAIALLYLDIDHFKSINDNHGHAIGDEVIKIFAERLNACVRADDLVARLGGDEFVVLIESPSIESGEAIAKKLLVAMREPMQVNELTMRLSTSIGVAYCAKTPTSQELLHFADKALYAAKDAGRDTFKTLVS